MKLTYTEEELKQKGFKLTEDGDELYYQYVFNKKDYFNSEYLATPTITHVNYLKDSFTIINPYNEVGEYFLGEFRLNYLLTKGGL